MANVGPQRHRKKKGTNKPVPVTARPQVWICGPSLAGVAGSSPVGGIDICLL